jgi:hypothetical protein
MSRERRNNYSIIDNNMSSQSLLPTEDNIFLTNGAMDSAGKCHSATLIFEHHLPFPITDPENEVQPEARVLEIERKDSVVIDGAKDKMSWTSGHSTRSLHIGRNGGNKNILGK